MLAENLWNVVSSRTRKIDMVMVNLRVFTRLTNCGIEYVGAASNEKAQVLTRLTKTQRVEQRGKNRGMEFFKFKLFSVSRFLSQFQSRTIEILPIVSTMCNYYCVIFSPFEKSKRTRSSERRDQNFGSTPAEKIL